MTLSLIKEQPLTDPSYVQITPLPAWRKVYRQNFTKLADLAAFLDLSPEQVQKLDTATGFTLNCPRRLAEKMAKQSIADPLFLQFVPLKSEKVLHPDYLPDPVQDARFVLEDKLLQKYSARALIIATSACAMHCRYCFRKNFDYQTQDKSFHQELECIRNDPSIEEIILSGGDPLSLSDETLERLLTDLSNIAHVRRIRFHSRFPMGIPERIDSSFLQVLKACPKQIWFVIHANHPNEFDNDIWHALKRIQQLGIPVLNQSVLLKGINDDLQTMRTLCQELIDHGVLPYYLHQLDRVQGSSHFEVAVDEGKALIAELAALLPGYAVPKYVQEIAGERSKTSL